VSFTDAQIAAAEYHVAGVLDWTMGAALPSRFLKVFFAKHMQASDDAAEGGDAGLGLWRTAKELCKIGTFHGLSCAHGDSVLAAACLATAHLSLLPVELPAAPGRRPDSECLVLHFCAVTVSSTGPRKLFKGHVGRPCEVSLRRREPNSCQNDILKA
jgi:hypothetical protein